MTSKQLYQELDYANHSREKRLYYANLISDEPKLILPLIEILFTVDDPISCRAAWVFEFLCSKSISPIIPYLDLFTQNISKVHLDPAVRPVAKICELLIKENYSKNDSKIKQSLTLAHKERIIEACFDWMINDQKVAVKAYSMTSLFLLGKDYDWIHPELRIILEQGYASHSAAFKARARHILAKLKA